jgi:hypothetical protein
LGAGITSLSVRSAFDQDQHEESQRVVTEMVALTAQLAARQARRREVVVVWAHVNMDIIMVDLLKRNP